jgi:hypothetical protein
MTAYRDVHYFNDKQIISNSNGEGAAWRVFIPGEDLFGRITIETRLSKSPAEPKFLKMAIDPLLAID